VHDETVAGSLAAGVPIDLHVADYQLAAWTASSPDDAAHGTPERGVWTT